MSKIFIIPGYQGSDDNHWQSRWETLFGEQIIRFKMDDFCSTSKKEWMDTITAQIKQINEPFSVVAHSLGALAFAPVFAENNLEHLISVMLVAPPDVKENPNAQFLKEFSSPTLFKFDVPAILVASTNDLYIDIQKAKKLADSWGAEFINIGAKGHINSESGLGIWQDGIELLNKLK